MNWALRLLISTAIFVGVLLVGDLFGIHPTFAEVVLVAMAAAFSNGASEALR